MYGTLLFFMLLTTSVLSQTPPLGAAGAITGTVHDPSDAAIVGARVTLIGADGATVAETTTDGRGTFHFDKLLPGD